MAQKMLMFGVLLALVILWGVREWMKGPDIVVYLQSPTLISENWSILIENPGPKPAQYISLHWTEINSQGIEEKNLRVIDMLKPGETVIQETSIQNGTLDVIMECCGGFTLSDRIDAGSRGPPHPLLLYNPLVHPIYSFWRFTGFLQPTAD